ncbi:hypothetical protein CW304_26130 [Bacillus sp. UFRGS-B20]|nr:hypothetical protein CW304_26130 [Bacillus sp. UFRGS-B20]
MNDTEFVPCSSLFTFLPIERCELSVEFHHSWPFLLSKDICMERYSLLLCIIFHTNAHNACDFT